MQRAKKIKILIIEDNKLLRDGLIAIINKQTDLKCVAAIIDREKIQSKIKEHNPGIILIDLGLRSQNSLEIVKEIHKNFLKVKTIIMDLLPTQSEILDFIKIGTSGFILKSASVQELLNSIRMVYKGEKILPRKLTSSLFTSIIENTFSKNIEDNYDESIRMTKREKQIVVLIAEGLSNKEIAHRLHLSTYTIKSHIHNIMEKMALHTRLQIAKFAFNSKEFNKTSGQISLLDDDI